MKSSRDINKYLQTTLIDVVNAFEFDRCSFLMMSDNKNHVKSRFVFDNRAISDPIKIKINIGQSENAIGRVLASKMPALINDCHHRQWRDVITKELAEFIQNGSLAIIPVKVGDKAIGVICAQYFSDHPTMDKTSKRKKVIGTDDFQQLCALIEHLNFCLTMILLH